MEKINDVLNDLKSLSDTTDQIIYQHTCRNERVDRWLTIIKETANAIINGTNSSESSEAKENLVIPDLTSEIKGEKLKAKRNRVSSFLAAAQNDHARLSHRKPKASLRKIILEKTKSNKWEISQSKRSDSKETAKNSTQESASTNAEDKISNSSSNNSRASAVTNKKSSSNKDESNYSTPPTHQNEILVPNSDDKTPVTNSKARDLINLNPVVTLKKLRCLSPNKKYCPQELTPDIIQKKIVKKNVTSISQTLKHVKNSEVSDPIKTNFSSTPENPEIETVTLDSSEASVGSESKPRTRSKRKSSIQLTQGKAKKNKNSSTESQGIKYTKPLREDSASGNKYPRRVRINKTAAKNAVIQPKTSGSGFQQINTGSEKRILREIQKKEEVVSQNTKRLRSLRQQKIEESKKMREIKMEKAMQQRLKIESEKKERMKSRTASKQENVQQKELSVKKTAQKKIQIEEKVDSVVKATPTSLQKVIPLTAVQVEKAVSCTPKKAPPKPVRTPIKKAKQSSDKQNPEQIEPVNLNQTYTNPSVEALSVKDVFTKPSPINSTYLAKDINVTSTPVVQKTVSKLTKTPVSSLKKKSNSYTMTPSESSFVSYDVSEIKSDDSDEEESNNNKPIPSWASGVRLRNALLNQQYNTIDTAELFGNYFETPDLATIMGIEKKHYFKRTSSAIWINSPNRSLLY